MRAGPSLALALVCLPSLVHAQGHSVADAIEPQFPGVTVTVVRETSLLDNPSFCQGSPKPWECGTYTFAPTGGNWPSAEGSGLEIGVDAAGAAYIVAPEDTFVKFDSYTYGYALQRLTSTGLPEEVAHLLYAICSNSLCNGLITNFDYSSRFHFDVTTGRILIRVRSTTSIGGTNVSDDRVGIVAIDGLPTMFDTLLTFIPGQQALNILTPAMPDGFRSADSLQVWAGDVRTMPDWSQAQPLACMAAESPSAGQLVSVADTLPDPAVGEGRYYLVASQSGPDRRLGRQYVNGGFSARQPGALPLCQ